MSGALSLNDDRLSVVDDVLVVSSGLGEKGPDGSVTSLVGVPVGEPGPLDDDGLVEDVLEVIRGERERSPVGALEGSAASRVGRSEDDAIVASRAS